MGAKKKPGEDDGDQSCEKFFIKYKKNCQALGIPVSKIIREKFEEEY